MTELTKKFQLVWNAETRKIIKKGGNSTFTNHPCFESDIEADVEAKIIEERLEETTEETSSQL